MNRAKLSAPPGVIGAKESDEALVHRCRGGDSGAFRILIARYERPLYNAAYRVLGNADDARDVTQVAFMEVAERVALYDPSHRFFSWLYRIALNAALNLLRRNSREEPLLGREPGKLESVDPESSAAESELSCRIQRALMQMSEDHRVVLTLRHFSDCSYREIGLILEIEEKTVKSRLFEARQRLRELLRDLELQ
jgi:RNA polymerase sigma-70 factor (ECF subfamily)